MNLINLNFRDHNMTSKHIALLVVPNNSNNSKFDDSIASPLKKALGHLSFPHTSSVREESSTRNPTLLMSRSRSQSRSNNESRERVSTISNEEQHVLDSGDSIAFVDFGLLLLTLSKNKDTELNNDVLNTGILGSGSRSGLGVGSGIGLGGLGGVGTIGSEEIKIEESFIHSNSGLYSLHDVYGVPSSYNYNNTERVNNEQKTEENDCVICLTEKKEIFLLPCR